MNWPTIFPASPAIQQALDDDGIGGNLLNVVRVSGLSGAGKTNFALRLIARRPGTKPAPVVAWDIEGGVAPFASQYAIKIHNARELDGGVFSPSKAWERFVKQVHELVAGEHAVALLDPAEEIEDFASEWLMANPGHFKRTPKQYFNNDRIQPLFWGDLKNLLKSVLTVLVQKVQTVVLVNHVSQVYQGNQPVPGQYKPKGKDVMRKLASLEMILIGNGEGAPSAVVTKSRINWLDYDNADEYGLAPVYPVFPPYIPKLDGATLREYLANPRKEFAPLELQVIDPWAKTVSEAERIAQQQELLAQRQRAATDAAKREMIRDLIVAGFYADQNELVVAVAEIRKEDPEFSFDKDPEWFRAQLISYAKARQGKQPAA